jgi:hypothetical protein
VTTDPLLELTLEEPIDTIDELAAALESGRVTLASSAGTLQYEFIHGPRTLDRMLAVLRSWAASGDATSLARVLRAQGSLRHRIEARGPRCELVWTGTSTRGGSLRPTMPVILEMLRHARRSVTASATPCGSMMLRLAARSFSAWRNSRRWELM